VFAYAAAQVKNASTPPTPRRRQLRAVGRPRGLRDLLNTDMKQEPTSSPGSCTWSSTQARHRVRGHAADRAEAAGADQAPVRLRRRDGARVPRALRPARRVKVNIEVNHATLSGHDFHHEIADRRRTTGSSARSTPTAATTAERLGHRPVPELGRADEPRHVRDPPRRRLHERRLQLRHQAAPAVDVRDDLFHGHIGGHRHPRPLAAGRGALKAAQDARYAGWDSALGAAITDGTADLASLEAKVVAGEIDPSAVSGRQEQLENLINRTIWSAS
jgi:xylose isomerase